MVSGDKYLFKVTRTSESLCSCFIAAKSVVYFKDLSNSSDASWKLIHSSVAFFSVMTNKKSGMIYLVSVLSWLKLVYLEYSLVCQASYYPVGEHFFNLAKLRQKNLLTCCVFICFMNFDGQPSKFLLNRNEQNFSTVLA